MAGYRGFSGKARSNAAVGSRGGAKSHTDAQAARIAQTRARSELNRTRAGVGFNAPALVQPTPSPITSDTPTLAAPVPGFGSDRPMMNPASLFSRGVGAVTKLGRQFSGTLSNPEALHDKVNMFADAYHNMQVFRSPGPYGYLHAMRIATAPRHGGMGGRMQEEISLERLAAEQNKTIRPGMS